MSASAAAWATGTEVKFDLDRLRARGLPVELANYYERGAHFDPGYNRVSLSVNGSSRGEVDAYFKPDGSLCVTRELLERAGLNVPERLASTADVSSSSGASRSSPCIDYQAAFPQTLIKLIPHASRIELIVPPQAVRRRARVPKQFDDGGVAGLLNYDAYLSQWRHPAGASRNFNVRSEGGFNAYGWIVRSHQSLRESRRRRYVFHDRAYAQRTLPNMQKTLQVGQILVSNGVIGGIPLDGLQLTPDTALLRTRLRAPRVEGIASSQASVVIRQAGRQVYSTIVPPGPFVIDDVELYSDMSDLTVTVIEEDGSRREFVVPVTPLGAGATVDAPGFSLALGNFNSRATAFPGAVLTGSGSLGPATSAAAAAVVAHYYQAVGAALTILPRRGSTLATRLLASRHLLGAASGIRASIRVSSRLGRDFSASVSAGARSAGFRHLFDSRANSRRCSTMDYSVQLNYAAPYGSVGLGYGQSFAAGSTTGRYVNGAISMQAAGVSVGLIARCDSSRFGKTRTSTYLNVSVPLGRTGIRAHGSLTDSVLRSGIRMNHSLGSRTHYSGSFQRDHARGDTSADVDVSHGNRFARMSASVLRSSRTLSYSAALSGSLAVHRDGFGFSPYRIGDTFGVVSTSGVPGVTIFTRAGAVETDRTGHAILPSLPAYAASPVEIATHSLPRNADVDNGYRAVQPARGSVQKVRFNVTTVRRVLLEVSTQGGSTLQRGTPVLDGTGNMVATVLDDRQVFLSRATPNEPLTVQLADGGRCQLTYTLPDAPDSGRTFERVSAHCIPVPADR
ncbi:fimbria/pilus outer membrane usher protein [Mycetohabitans sp. B8]|uniref:fimbria/pilus outer membrane usher protein n=1 Tax=Mycetohabitans sp. B8 TaxID=2841845 RepID=UPI001F002947|nr:fimbria/pilus outer membrane usher protein [Mycetohabitans sp. B8]MCG1041314.1 fimbria/pilus outer membrane usher protein [Mycetohabitans sp. B8]